MYFAIMQNPLTADMIFSIALIIVFECIKFGALKRMQKKYECIRNE